MYNTNFKRSILLISIHFEGTSSWFSLAHFSHCVCARAINYSKAKRSNEREWETTPNPKSQRINQKKRKQPHDNTRRRLRCRCCSCCCCFCFFLSSLNFKCMHIIFPLSFFSFAACPMHCSLLSLSSVFLCVNFINWWPIINVEMDEKK